jgi:hypothetical protein
MRSRLLRALAACTFLFSLSCGGAPAVQRASAPDDDLPLPPLPWEREREDLGDVASPLVAIVGGTILTATGQHIEDGVLVMENGRIRAVGARGDVEIPEGASVVDATDRFVTPGIIDVHSHMGVYPVPRSPA